MNSGACLSFKVCVPLCVGNSFMMRPPAKRHSQNVFIIVVPRSSRVKRRCFDDMLYMSMLLRIVTVDFSGMDINNGCIVAFDS